LVLFFQISLVCIMSFRIICVCVCFIVYFILFMLHSGGSVAEWLACWTQAQKGPGPNRSRDAALLRVAGVTAGLAENNGSLPPGL